MLQSVAACNSVKMMMKPPSSSRVNEKVTTRGIRNKISGQIQKGAMDKIFSNLKGAHHTSNTPTIMNQKCSKAHPTSVPSSPSSPNPSTTPSNSFSSPHSPPSHFLSPLHPPFPDSHSASPPHKNFSQSPSHMDSSGSG